MVVRDETVDRHDCVHHHRARPHPPGPSALRLLWGRDPTYPARTPPAPGSPFSLGSRHSLGTAHGYGMLTRLTVRAPGNQPTEVSLEQPGPPLHDEATAGLLRELMAKGALSGLVFIADDVRALYDSLRERGVTDFTQEPTEHFYGVDMGLRDP